MEGTELFRLENIAKKYGKTQALHPTSFTVHQGQSLGIIGESGSGKTTLTRLMLGLSEPSEGTVVYKGQQVVAGKRGPNQLRQEVQLVLQDPFSSLNPRMTVGRIIAEPLQLLHTPGNRRDMVREALAKVMLDPALASRYPHQLSGGQRQRVAIARAIASRPQVIIADEPVSALDVSVRATVIDLLADLRQRLKLTLVVVSHDLGIVQQLCEKIMVLRDGKTVEYGDTSRVLRNPQHAATRELLDAVPVLPME